ncbi:longitudinals lacking protein [Megalopta genalis]|uniref:longitudinals lacking protein n=1 Tax=Megalopta genalis TaxID=115081 RepID=UPI003FCF36D6
MCPTGTTRELPYPVVTDTPILTGLDVVVSALLWPYKTVYVFDEPTRNNRRADQRQPNGSPADPRERSFVCADCGKAYAVHRSLWRHRKFECVNAKPKLACEACPYQSPHKWCIENHKKRHHSNVQN